MHFNNKKISLWILVIFVVCLINGLGLLFSIKALAMKPSDVYNLLLNYKSDHDGTTVKSMVINSNLFLESHYDVNDIVFQSINGELDTIKRIQQLLKYPVEFKLEFISVSENDLIPSNYKNGTISVFYSKEFGYNYCKGFMLPPEVANLLFSVSVKDAGNIGRPHFIAIQDTDLSKINKEKKRSRERIVYSDTELKSLWSYSAIIKLLWTIRIATLEKLINQNDFANLSDANGWRYFYEGSIRELSYIEGCNDWMSFYTEYFTFRESKVRNYSLKIIVIFYIQCFIVIITGIVLAIHLIRDDFYSTFKVEMNRRGITIGYWSIFLGTVRRHWTFLFWPPKSKVMGSLIGESLKAIQEKRRHQAILLRANKLLATLKDLGRVNHRVEACYKIATTSGNKKKYSFAEREAAISQLIDIVNEKRSADNVTNIVDSPRQAEPERKKTKTTVPCVTQQYQTPKSLLLKQICHLITNYNCDFNLESLSLTQLDNLRQVMTFMSRTAIAKLLSLSLEGINNHLTNGSRLMLAIRYNDKNIIDEVLGLNKTERSKKLTKKKVDFSGRNFIIVGGEVVVRYSASLVRVLEAAGAKAEFINCCQLKTIDNRLTGNNHTTFLIFSSAVDHEADKRIKKSESLYIYVSHFNSKLFLAEVTEKI